MKIILVNGKKRSGKDFFAAYLRDEIDRQGKKAIIRSFADPMKQIVSTTFGISVQDLEIYKNNPRDFKVFLSHHDLEFAETNFRKVLQLFGTEGMKPYFGDDVWVKLLKDSVKDADVDYVIVPDFRFKIEAISSLTVRVRNKKIEEQCTDTHASENELNDFPFLREIDNTGLPDLGPQVKELIKFLEQV